MNPASVRPLNCAQLDLLRLILSAGPTGCAVYGRPYSATVTALVERGLVARIGSIRVASMGSLELRQLWIATPEGSMRASEGV